MVINFFVFYIFSSVRTSTVRIFRVSICRAFQMRFSHLFSRIFDTATVPPVRRARHLSRECAPAGRVKASVSHRKQRIASIASGYPLAHFCTIFGGAKIIQNACWWLCPQTPDFVFYECKIR